MWLRLDLEGIDFRMRISGYEPKRSDDEDHGGRWCQVDLLLQAQDWLRYRKENDEVLEFDEVERLRDSIGDLLDHKTDQPTVMNCTEPDFEFRFYPAGDTKDGDHGLYVRQGYFEIKDVFMEFALSFYDKGWGLMTTQLVMFFNRNDLEKLLCYLRFITGTVSDGGKEVTSMIDQGCLYESEEERETIKI